MFGPEKSQREKKHKIVNYSTLGLFRSRDFGGVLKFTGNKRGDGRDESVHVLVNL